MEHPHLILEPSNLEACQSSPIDPEFSVRSPNGLSVFQIEMVRKIMWTFLERKGFYLGLATGVGKGRINASVMQNMYLHNPRSRSIWVSANQNLYADAIRDFKDIACETAVPVSDKMDSIHGGGVYYTTYSKLRTEALKVVQWLRRYGNSGVIVLDECHVTRNSVSKTHAAVKTLQDRLPGIPVLYSSATLASGLANISVMDRLDLWGPRTDFPDYPAFYKALAHHGTAALELVAAQLKRNGMYECRYLDHRNVEFNVETVDMIRGHLNPLYEKLRGATMSVGNTQSKRNRHLVQRLGIESLKTERCISIISESLNRNESVIISVQSTGAAIAKRHTSHEPTNVLTDFLDVDTEFPLSPVDQIINHFGANMVSEITGRSSQFVFAAGKWSKRAKPKNRLEIMAFQQDRKRIAVISSSGATGISLHDSNGVHRRHHILLELPWGVECLTQHVGRTHRASQRTAPKVTILSTNLPYDKRKVHSVGQRLRDLGALMHGDRDASVGGKLSDTIWSSGFGSRGFESAVASRSVRSFALDLCVRNYCQIIHPNLSVENSLTIMYRKYAEDNGAELITEPAFSKQMTPSSLSRVSRRLEKHLKEMRRIVGIANVPGYVQSDMYNRCRHLDELSTLTSASMLSGLNRWNSGEIMWDRTKFERESLWFRNSVVQMSLVMRHYGVPEVLALVVMNFHSGDCLKVDDGREMVQNWILRPGVLRFENMCNSLACLPASDQERLWSYYSEYANEAVEYSGSVSSEIGIVSLRKAVLAPHMVQDTRYKLETRVRSVEQDEITLDCICTFESEVGENRIPNDIVRKGKTIGVLRSSQDSVKLYLPGRQHASRVFESIQAARAYGFRKSHKDETLAWRSAAKSYIRCNEAKARQRCALVVITVNSALTKFGTSTQTIVHVAPPIVERATAALVIRTMYMRC